VRISQPYLKERQLLTEELFGEGAKIDTNNVYYGMGIEEIQKGILDVLKQIKSQGRMPVVNFAAGGVATPADGALMMKMGVDGVFVGSGIFKSRDPNEMAKAIVDAVENFEDYELIGQVSEGLEGMQGTAIENIPSEMKMQNRGW
jgi:pyridoxal 5'-phosphate synthase pdxS subunit